ncbi:MAG: metallophosphoesterase family protein, partial [Brooklawnia sp.]
QVHFLHTSDWQLGMTRHYLAGEAQARFTGDRIDAIRRIGALARQVGAEFIVVAGDVFEHANLPRAEVTRALGAMGEAGVPIYLLPGNHDPLDAASIYYTGHFRDACPASVHVLDHTGVFEVRPGVELVAAPWFGKHPEADPVAGALAGLTADGTLRIVVGHGMLSGITYSGQESSVEVRREPLQEALGAGLIHYVALGDRHIRWPADGQGPIQYSGTHESTDFTEPGRGQVLEVTLASTDLQVAAHEVGRWQHIRVERDLDGADDLDELDEYLSGLDYKECTIVKHVLRGTLSLRQSARLDELLERHGEVLASLEPWERHSDLVVIPDQAEFDDLPLGGYLRSAVTELRDQSAEGDEVAAGALKLLYRLAGPSVRGENR